MLHTFPGLQCFHDRSLPSYGYTPGPRLVHSSFRRVLHPGKHTVLPELTSSRIHVVPSHSPKIHLSLSVSKFSLKTKKSLNYFSPFYVLTPLHGPPMESTSPLFCDRIFSHSPCSFPSPISPPLKTSFFNCPVPPGDVHPTPSPQPLPPPPTPP